MQKTKSMLRANLDTHQTKTNTSHPILGCHSHKCGSRVQRSNAGVPLLGNTLTQGSLQGKVGTNQMRPNKTERRVFSLIRSVQLCVGVLLICAHMFMLFAETWYRSGNISKSFWHWCLLLENWVRAGMIGRRGDRQICTSGATTVTG